MPYADAVIKEVMRLHGIVDGVWRQALEDITVQGHSIPKVRSPQINAQGFLRIPSRHKGSMQDSAPCIPVLQPAAHAALLHGGMGV